VAVDAEVENNALMQIARGAGMAFVLAASQRRYAVWIDLTERVA